MACGKAGIKVKQHSAGWNIGIVSKFANVKEAAELLIHNKFYKSGQHLDNVDVIYVDESVYNTFLIESKNALYKFYTSLG
jgi:acyl-CoA reductase-like NAD-dependent aldehyde dehydrogenase